MMRPTRANKPDGYLLGSYVAKVDCVIERH
jgi:hypothetical protein